MYPDASSEDYSADVGIAAIIIRVTAAGAFILYAEGHIPAPLAWIILALWAIEAIVSLAWGSAVVERHGRPRELGWLCAAFGLLAVLVFYLAWEWDWGSKQQSSQASGHVRSVASWISLGVAVSVAVSALMPWGHLSFIVSVSAVGTQFAEGKAVLVLGLLAAAVSVARMLGVRSVLTSLPQFAFASAALANAVYVLHELLTGCGDLQAICNALIGDGLYLAVFGSALLVAVSVVEFVLDVRASSPTSTAERHR